MNKFDLPDPRIGKKYVDSLLYGFLAFVFVRDSQQHFYGDETGADASVSFPNWPQNDLDLPAPAVFLQLRIL